MHEIPFFGEECLIKEKRLKKDMDQFRVGEEKVVGAGEDVFFFKVQVIFIVNFLSSYIQMQATFWDLSAHVFSLFSLG